MKHYYETLLNVPVHLLSESYFYIQASDKAHNEEHIRAVVKAADKLSHSKGVAPGSPTYDAIILAALCHDLGCSVKGGRDIHEKLSTVIFKGLIADLNIGSTVEELAIQGILQHRASFKGERTTLVAKIVAAADRCDALNIGLLFWRSYIYAKDTFDVCHDVAIAHSHEHIKHKFGASGRGCLLNNPVMMQFYPEECRQLTERMSTITVDDVRSLIEAFGK